jgi:predicted Fe-S protein YdhL (DUF1289 family)
LSEFESNSDRDREIELRAERRAERRRNRKRSRRAPSFDTSVPSPCISVCQVDNATGCCIGCYRSIDEIREWPILTADEKQAALARIAARKAAAGPIRRP